VTAGVREALTTAWDSLAHGPAGDREWRALRIDLAHKLDVFAAVRETDRTRGVLFECPVAYAPAWRLRFESEGLHLADDREGREGTRRIALALERGDLKTVFLVVAEDLIESSRVAVDAQEAVAILGARLSAWQTCLKLRRGGFSLESMLGLYGELMILERLASAVGMARAVVVWAGPERGLHDFEEGGVAVEVKTCQGVSGAVRIGSLDQLDPSGLHQLALCRVVVVPDDAGMTLADLVARVRVTASAAGPSARRGLDQRLLMSGYIDPGDRDEPFERLSVVAVEAYEVCGDFPRVTRETVPAAVLSAEYRLDVHTAGMSRMADAVFDEFLACFKEKC
jgi:Putative  PD-(D/E)XK family member, (DUF4420)